MQALQQKREAINRQINDGLKTLIAAYRTLGGSFTCDLRVAPSHLRDVLPVPAWAWALGWTTAPGAAVRMTRVQCLGPYSRPGIKRLVRAAYAL